MRNINALKTLEQAELELKDLLDHSTTETDEAMNNQMYISLALRNTQDAITKLLMLSVEEPVKPIENLVKARPEEQSGED